MLSKIRYQHYFINGIKNVNHIKTQFIMTKTVRLKTRMSGMMRNQKQIDALKSKW